MPSPRCPSFGMYKFYEWISSDIIPFRGSNYIHCTRSIIVLLLLFFFIIIRLLSSAGWRRDWKREILPSTNVALQINWIHFGRTSNLWIYISIFYYSYLISILFFFYFVRYSNRPYSSPYRFSLLIPHPDLSFFLPFFLSFILPSNYIRAQDLFVSLSFTTISSSGANAAVIHYSPEPQTCAPLRKDWIYLVDSGGQYRDGTTDVTRTLHFGNPTQEERRNFTLVLQGHINLAEAVFPEGTVGMYKTIINYN